MRTTTSIQRIQLILPLAALIFAVGCRTTHEADEDEMAQINRMADALGSGDDAAGDSGEGSVGALFGSWGYFQSIGDKSNNSGGGPRRSYRKTLPRTGLVIAATT